MPTETQLSVQQSEKYEGDDWWSWAVWLEGPKAELDGVACVEYTLHPTFSDPVRRVDRRSSNFKLSMGGWGVFPIHVRIVMESGIEYRLQHELALHYPDGKANTA